MSYPAVMRTLCGRAGGLLLELSLVFRCAGLMIVSNAAIGLHAGA